MTPKRLYFVLIGLFMVLAGSAVGLTLYSTNWLKEKSAGVVSVKLETAALEEQKKTAVQAENDLKKYADIKESVEKIVPKTKDQALAVAELLQIAEDVNATISSITFPSSDLGAAAPKAPTSSETSGSTDSTAQQSQPQTSSAPKTSAVSQAKTVEGLSGILGVEVILSQIDTKGTAIGTGLSYQQLIDFLKAVERNRRTMQVKNIQVQPIRAQGGDVTGYTLALTLTIFVKP